MSGLKQIKKRIGTVKNTQKITRAMKMVAAARLRRAQQDITELRPYALKTMSVLSGVAARTCDDRHCHPLLDVRDVNRIVAVVITSDRGLAGGFNANINKAAYRFAQEKKELGQEVTFAVIGRKGRDYLKRRNAHIAHEFTDVFNDLSVDNAGEIARYIINHYQGEELDAAYLVYNEFKSAISQQVVIEPLLPITPMVIPESESNADFIYEPNKIALLDRLLPMYVQVECYRALLESVASEHGARMTAMDAATNNAKDMISKLTLQYNRARQAAITKELMEIIGGAEALR